MGNTQNEKLLLRIIEGMKLSTAPVKTQRMGTHYEFTVGIGNDETAFITMAKEAYDTLIKRSAE